MAVPRSILSRELLPASVAIFTTVAIVAFEGLAITAALPEVAADLGDVGWLPWVITAFLLASAVTTAVSGAFIDAHGTATIFRLATIVFAVSSLGAAFAPSMPLLILSRVIQGAASGAIISVGIAAVALVYPNHLTGRALAANSNVWGVLGFASPALAAALLEVASWRWIFLVMVPICFVALVAGWKTLPGAVAPSSIGIDWIATALLVLAVGSALAAVSDLGTTSLLMMTVAAVSVWVLRRRLSSSTKPVIDLGFVTTTPYGHLAAAASLTLAAVGGLAAFLPVYVRGARGASASTAAWSVLWMTIGWTMAANVAGRITDRFNERTVLRVGAVIGPLAIGAAWLAVSSQAPLPVVFACYFFMGTSVGTVTNAALQQVRRAVAGESAGRATSAHAFVRTMGLSIGTGLFGGVILGVVATRITDIGAVRSALAGEAAELAGPATVALGDGFAVAHLAALVLMMMAVFAAFRLRPTHVQRAS